MKISILIFFAFVIACQPAHEEQDTAENHPSEVALAQPSLPEEATVSTPAMLLSEEALLGKISPARDTGFTRIAARYTDKEEIYLRTPAYEDFVRMAAAAAEEGIDLEIISATRNFAAQKSIWEAKWNGQRKVDGMDLSQAMPDPQERALKILEYSSMPGTSRHHWGTDIDLNSLNNQFFASGEGKKIYDWLQANAHEYGYCQVYTEQGDKRPYGYHEEKWHWSYMPLASQFLDQYNEKISYEDLGGFEGGQVAEEIEAIRKYVNGIAPPCRDWVN
jgi:LAS superfamily LD-carboxypeptidase LdcB